MLPAERVALTASSTSTEPAAAASSGTRSIERATTDGSLVTFVVPEVPSGSLLRLRLDGTDLPVAVKVTGEHTQAQLDKPSLRIKGRVYLSGQGATKSLQG